MSRRPNPLRVFWYRAGWWWTCWYGPDYQTTPHTAGYGSVTPGEAADAARRHFQAAHPGELIILYARKGATS